MTRQEKLEKAATKYAQDKYLPVQTAQSFKAGAKWADEHPADYDGKAMLYVLNKGVEQGKQEMLDKTCEWLENNLLNYWQQINTDSSKFIEDFRKAMEE